MNKKRFPKLVIVPSELSQESFYNKDFIKCPYCNSNLIYVRIDEGIIKEENWYGVMGNKSNRTYRVQEVGFSFYCAECGDFIEHYAKFFHDDEIVHEFEKDLDEDERAEIEYCLSQFNQKRDFVPQYKFPELNIIKEKLLEFEKKYPEKEEKKIRRKS
jgi:DNA-directed RNA polymerase subunit RPC12/RpoP